MIDYCKLDIWYFEAISAEEEPQCYEPEED